jgi:arginyl-tRNA synthetase
MVNLPEGRMKTREGTVVDADTLLDSLSEMAKEEIREKEREELVGDTGAVAEKIALGAVHYYLLQVSPEREMLFNPKESLSFNGNTGPYLQYMGARISSLLKKAEDNGYKTADFDISFFDTYTAVLHDGEWEILKTLARWQESLALAAKKYNPQIIALWIYELSKNFSRFYHDYPILAAGDDTVIRFRLALCKAVRDALRSALELIGVPFLEAM